MDPVRRLQIALLLIAGLGVVGVLVYSLIEGLGLLDALYMTVITLSTVGYREIQPPSPAGQVFTIGLILAGIILGAWALSNAAEILLGQQLWHTLEKRRMQHRIDQLSDHFVVCGYGRMGRTIISEFQRRGVQCVVVDNNQTVLAQLLEEGRLFVGGDATHDETLVQAQIDCARGLVTGVSSDTDNIVIVFSAKAINPDLYVVARATTDEAEHKLQRAGANAVISPYAVGGNRIALAALRPTVAEFLDHVIYNDVLHTEIEEVRIQSGSWLVGKTLAEADLRRLTGAVVLAIKDPFEGLVISPPSDQVLCDDEILVVVASSRQMNRLRELCC